MLFFQVSLAEAEEEHQKVVLIIDQLEEEKSKLIKQVEKLNNTVEDMGNRLSVSHRQYDQLRNVSKKLKISRSFMKTIGTFLC